MSENNKLTRREAIKLLGAASGAVTLANLPAKWSRPELANGLIPAHAQTSLCPAGQSTLSMFVQASAAGSALSVRTAAQYVDPNGSLLTGTTFDIACESGCLGLGIESTNAVDVHVIFTVNGLVVFDQIYNNQFHYVFVDAATGAYQVDGAPSAGCPVIWLN